MDQEMYQYLKDGIGIASKTGLLGRLFSRVNRSESVEIAPGPEDHRERAIQLLQENAVETLANMELTVKEALQILGPGFALEELDQVNSTWQKHWTEGVSQVGIDDGERRTWWARLLVGEIQQPGAYSLRTLSIMDTLSTTEAELFTKLCGYVWTVPMSDAPTSAPRSTPTIITPPDASRLWKPHVGESRLLEDAGLVHDNTFDYRMGNRTALALSFHNEEFILLSGAPKEIRFGRLMLTSTGAEIYKLTTPERSQIYLDEILAEWRSQSWSVTNS